MKLNFYSKRRCSNCKNRISRKKYKLIKFLLELGETSRGIHGLSKVTKRDETEDHGVLRAPLPRKILRRGIDPWRALGEIKRSTKRNEISSIDSLGFQINLNPSSFLVSGRDQLQLQIVSRVRAILCQCRFQLCLGCRYQIEIRSLPARYRFLIPIDLNRFYLSIKFNTYHFINHIQDKSFCVNYFHFQ